MISRYGYDLKTDYIIAEKIICSSHTDNGELLLTDTPRQAFLGNERLCTIAEGGYVLLDFGMEYQGGIDITVQHSSGDDALLRVVFGESVTEALSVIGENNATNDHAFRDINIGVTSYSNFRIGNTGFRFVKLEAACGTVSLAGVRAAFEYRNLEYSGSFECSDETLNKIWRTGARTVHLNMQEYLWDGIKRDRLVWVGDMHAEVSAIRSVFGYNDIVNKSLDFIMNLTPPNKWMNGIPSYNFWWLIIQRDWYLYTGDLRYLQSNAEYIYDVLKNIFYNINGDSFAGLERYFLKQDKGDSRILSYFTDWETYGTPDSKKGFFALLILALNASVCLCEVLGNRELANTCIDYISSIKSMNFSLSHNRQIASLMALSGFADIKTVNSEILSREPVAEVSTFLGYYTLLAKGMAGDVCGALDIIKGYWGRMLELGATSFWESFDLSAAKGAAPIDRIPLPGETDVHGDLGAFCYKQLRCSLCHGWACGPTPFLSEYVLGVHMLEPGCRAVFVKPDIAGLDYVRGTFPTPFGNIEIECEKAGNKFLTDVKAPSEIRLVKE